MRTLLLDWIRAEEEIPLFPRFAEFVVGCRIITYTPIAIEGEPSNDDVNCNWVERSEFTDFGSDKNYKIVRELPVDFRLDL